VRRSIVCPNPRSLPPLLVLALLSGPLSAGAFDFADGRLHVNGYLEAQLRTIARDFSTSDELDLTQWWNILDVEIEADIAPDGWGPFDVLSAFARLEGRYDCVWTHACGIFSSADTYGDRAGHLPGRLGDGRRAGFRSSGTLFNGDTRGFAGIPREFLDFQFSRPPLGPVSGPRRASKFFDIEGIDTLYDTAGPDEIFNDVGPGPDGILGTDDDLMDDPAPFIFGEVEDHCEFGFRKIRGREDGVGHQVLGPWNPGCKIDPTGRLSDKPHPLRAADPNFVVLGGQGGFGALPLRPAPEVDYREEAPSDVAKGIYLPNPAYAQMLRDDAFHNPDQTFRQAELEWNHGASQQDEKELKELYLDMEFFDSRLWIRAGKQTVVWGKTELFRNQDQFNPQDVALASLPSLEESRIALWALRGVWSFYDVGPLEDVRLELAGNYDEFEPTDLGRCGEPYAPLPVCDKTYGLFIHGLTGLGLAGEVRPEDPWDDAEGIEFGGRLEFRWDRYSFAISDFYGFADLPYQDVLYTYSRNVDPETGRPRAATSDGECVTGAEPACLVGNDPVTGEPAVDQCLGLGPDGPDPGTEPDPIILPCTDPAASTTVVRRGFPPGSQGQDALENHPVNQQVFAMICATSVGLLPSLDPTACGQTVFNSKNSLTGVPIDPALVLTDGEASISELLSNAVVGNPLANGVLVGGLANAPVPFVTLLRDPCDGFLADPDPSDSQPCGPPAPIGSTTFAAGGNLTANLLLTAQQQALLGCGEFYGTNCELDGIDLMNTEASALVQSWPGVEGAGGLDWDTTDASVAQPGTMAFIGQSGPVCTRFENGALVMLPGCRGPGPDYVAGTADDDPGFDPNVDGYSDPDGDGFSNVILHPFFDPNNLAFYQGTDSFTEFGLDQSFRSEMAALSFNALMVFVALSSAADLDGDGALDPTVGQFDPRNPTVTGSNGRDDDEDELVDEPDEGDPAHIGPYRADGCSYSRTHLCSNVQSLYQVTGLQRNTLRAGGGTRFGRRDFVWQGGSPLVLRYDKRNVLGFSMDFAEDRTKSSWGVEFTWVEGVTFADFDERDRTRTGQTFNTTISIDRPTFINFLNANRTFFLNSQWFVQWVDGYRESFPSDGPWNVLATLTIQTGFFRDRFQPNMTFVYDFGSNSGAWLPSVTYRYTENFSVSFGAAVFAGRMAARDMPLSPTSLGNRAGRHAYDDFVENGLSVVRERDELFLRVRYTF
jgi:hypothetical protein